MYTKPLLIGCMKLGTWGAQFNTTELGKFVDECLELGLDEFDHADIYGGHTTEREFGTLLSSRPDLKQKLKLTTKCGIAYPSDQRPEIGLKHYNSSKEYILKCIDASLRDLQVEQIHTFLIHRPDYLMNFEEIADAISTAKTSGKILHFGVSNFKPEQIQILSNYVEVVTNQIEISIDHLEPFENGSLEMLLSKKIQPCAWSPLAGGQVFTSDQEKYQRIRKVAEELAEKYTTELEAILVAWLRKHPAGIIPVLGTSKVARIKSALKGASITLTHEEWYSLWTASTGHKVA